MPFYMQFTRINMYCSQALKAPKYTVITVHYYTPLTQSALFIGADAPLSLEMGFLLAVESTVAYLSY